MSWLKIGRWLLVGIVGLNGAAACGGRGNLPAGAMEGDSGGDFGGATAGVTVGGRATAGAVSFGGATTRGGANAFGGATNGGTSMVGGSLNMAGMGGVCMPGLGMCKGNALATCNAVGTGYTVKACVPGEVCLQTGNIAKCQKQICTPGQLQCDKSGGLVQACS